MSERVSIKIVLFCRKCYMFHPWFIRKNMSIDSWWTWVLQDEISSDYGVDYGNLFYLWHPHPRIQARLWQVYFVHFYLTLSLLHDSCVAFPFSAEKPFRSPHSLKNSETLLSSSKTFSSLTYRNFCVLRINRLTLES